MPNSKLTDEKLVLLVDDDPLGRESLSELLDAKGYSVLEAENGQTALEVLKKTPHFPCLIVLDLAMPVMDGREFLKLRAVRPDPARHSGGRGFRKHASWRTACRNRRLSPQARES